MIVEVLRPRFECLHYRQSLLRLKVAQVIKCRRQRRKPPLGVIDLIGHLDNLANDLICFYRR
jgi:hypothetical protein